MNHHVRYLGDMKAMLSVGESSTNSRCSVPNPKINMSNCFSPSGLHVLVVDDDPLCLMVLERMLKVCCYKVTTCTRVKPALQILRERKDDFDLVMSDVYMPDEDGFKLLEIVGLEMDLPVIMMSANGDTNVVMEGITHGACDYLIKPIRMEELRNIWQHVIRRKGKDALKTELQDQSSKKRKELLELEDHSIDHVNSMKKARVNWSMQLHKEFVDAVNQVGVDKVVPKKILEIMKVPGLTRENVASHLQKYRLYLKRLSGIEPEPCPIAAFKASNDGVMGGKMMVQTGAKGLTSNVGVKGLNLGAGIPSKSGKSKELDSGTIESLVQFTLHQQKHAANREQVLGSLGLSDAQSHGISIPEGGLQRMVSFDLSLFLQSQHIGSSLHERPLDDLAFRSAKSYVTPEMALPYKSHEHIPISKLHTSMGMTGCHNYNGDTCVKPETNLSQVMRPGSDNNEAYESTSQPFVTSQTEHISSDVPYKTAYPAPVVEIDYDMISSSMRNNQPHDIMNAPGHLLENTQLDISDYLPLDDPCAYKVFSDV